MAAYTATQDGNWNDAATWGGGGYPSANDDTATIAYKVTYNAGASAIVFGSVTINSGGMLVFPSGASSTMKFSGTADLTVNSGGEIRTGSTSAVADVDAAYTLSIEWAQGSSARYVFVINNGAIINIQGDSAFYGGSRYADLDADWTSGQAFYVVGDYSAKWTAGQKFYIHQNADYVSNGYQTQGDVFTIASVGSYDSGNDRTQITISESAPGLTFTAVHATTGHQSKLIMISRNVVLSDPAATLGVYDHSSYTEYIRLDFNQAGTNFLVNFQDCRFSGWNYGFYGGANLVCVGCCFVSNINGIIYGSNHTITGDFVSNNSGIIHGSNHTITGDFVSNDNGISAGSNNTITGDFVSNTINISVNSETLLQTVVLEDCLISSTDRFPIRVYTNAGNILPLTSGDTDWQTPGSGNSWIMQTVANSYCTFLTRANQISYSPLRYMATYAAAAATTLTIKLYPVGWTTSLDQDDVVLEVKYLDSAAGITRTTVYNTSQTYANGAWRDCSVTFTPSQAGIVYFQLYFRSYESGCYVLIDPVWSVA